MNAADHYIALPGSRRRLYGGLRVHPQLANRGLVVAAVIGAAIAGFSATGAHEAGHAATLAGPDLVRLLRGMAVIKSMMAMAVIGAILWRLGAPIGPGRLALTVVACATMAAGPGLIWDMGHVGLGALLLHGGLASGVLLLWRDPGTSVLLTAKLRTKTLLFEKNKQKTFAL